MSDQAKVYLVRAGVNGEDEDYALENSNCSLEGITALDGSPRQNILYNSRNTGNVRLVPNDV